jgi:hypothetical protein
MFQLLGVASVCAMVYWWVAFASGGIVPVWRGSRGWVFEDNIYAYELPAVAQGLLAFQFVVGAAGLVGGVTCLVVAFTRFCRNPSGTGHLSGGRSISAEAFWCVFASGCLGVVVGLVARWLAGEPVGLRPV